MPVDTETDVEKVEIVRDEQNNVQRPANTAEQQATQDAIDAAKSELLSKLDTVGADPIEVRGDRVNITLGYNETIQVPAGSAFKVSIITLDSARAIMDQSASTSVTAFDGGGSNKDSSGTVWLQEGEYIVSDSDRPNGGVIVAGWEL